MRLVSSRIQSGIYSSIDFLDDVEAFSVRLKSTNGIEKERTEAFDVYVQQAVKDTNFAQNHWSQRFNDNCKVEDAAAIVDSKIKSSHRINSKSSLSIKTILPSELNQNRGSGIADLFQDAVEAATGLIKTETDTISQAGSIEATATRVSSIFQSLYENGSQHGCLHLTGSKKTKRNPGTDGKTLTPHAYTSNSTLFQRQQSNNILRETVKKTTCSSTTTPVPLKSAKVAVIQLQQLESLSQTATRKSPTSSKRANRSKKVDDEQVPVNSKKKGRFSYASQPIASWLQVDAMRAVSGTSGLSALSSQVVSADAIATTTSRSSAAVKLESGTASKADVGGTMDPVWTSAGVSIFSGVSPLINTNRKSTGASSSGHIDTEGEVVYSARIVLLGRNVDLGMFPTEEAAARYSAL